MNLSFSTDDVSYKDRIEYWQDVACKAFVELNCRPESRKSFSAKIRSGMLAEVGVSLVDTDASVVTRTRTEIARSKNDDILLSVQMAGSTILSQGDRVAKLLPGQFALYDTQQPYSLRVGRNSRQLVLKIPRALIESRIGRVANHVAKSIDPHSPYTGLAYGYFKLLPVHLEKLDYSASSFASEQALDLLAMSCLRSSEIPRSELSTSSQHRLQALKAVVEAGLDKEQFTPSVAADRAGMSVRYANLLLGSEGQSVEQFIFYRRLERSRHALMATQNIGKSISEIAYMCGFSSAAHFSRRFKKAYGMTPSDYRKSATWKYKSRLES